MRLPKPKCLWIKNKTKKKVNLHTDRAVRRVVSRERDNKSLGNNSLVRKMAARSRIKGKGKSLCRCFKGTVSIFCGLGGWTLQLPSQCKYRNHLQEVYAHSWGNKLIISPTSIEQEGLSKEFSSGFQPQLSPASCCWGRGRKVVSLPLLSQALLLGLTELIYGGNR